MTWENEKNMTQRFNEQRNQGKVEKSSKAGNETSD